MYFSLVVFLGAVSCYPFQSFVPNPGTKGFPLLSGLGLYVFISHWRNEAISRSISLLANVLFVSAIASFLARTKKATKKTCVNPFKSVQIRAPLNTQRYFGNSYIFGKEVNNADFGFAAKVLKSFAFETEPFGT
jgi:hypothetical protein